tara:strand:+ start:2372 stop:3721 length:1350 start_codon:yes stop_codon:yes gene_type:complete
MIIDKNKLYINSFILSSPGFVSVFFSLFAIPIHLNVLGSENFGNYIFFHLILSFSFLLCLGLPKSIIIASGKNQSYKKEISYEGLKYTFFLAIFIFVINTINEKYIFYYFVKFNQTYLAYGMIISIIYLVFEGILQSNKKFLFLSFNNLIFYSFSLSIPSILLLFFKELKLDDLILISIIIKLAIVVFIFCIFIKKKLIKKSKKNMLIDTLKINSLWLTLNSFLVQIYEMLDKYLIKILLGATSLALYSIPQQLTGKLSVLSRGFSSFLMPYLSSGSKLEEYEKTLKIFFCIFPLFIFILFPFYSFILNTWLGDSFENEILILTKIFSLIAILSSTSHILITRFEAEQLSKANFNLEIIFLPIFFTIMIIVFLNYSSLILISLTILIKELVLNIVRILYLNKKLNNTKIYLINILFHHLLLIFSFLNLEVFIILLTILIYINIKNVFFN